MARVFIPRTELNRVTSPYNTPLNLVAFPEFLLLQVIEYSDQQSGPRHIEYQLNRDLTLRNLVWNDYTAAMHERLRREGKIRTPLEEETARLKSEVEAQIRRQLQQRSPANRAGRR